MTLYEFLTKHFESKMWKHIFPVKLIFMIY